MNQKKIRVNTNKNNIKFNPIKEDKDGVIAKRAIWSTDSITLALKGLGEGRKLIANPFYEYNTKLLKGDLVFDRTPEEIEEWKRCSNDIIYFAEKYCKLMTPEGIQHVTLRDYQKDYLNHLEKNRLSVFLSCRQSAKTTTSALFILHYICFNIDKNALVLGNKRKTAVEILDKLKKIYYELPYFLKPGIYKWNEAEIVLDNGCRIMAEATTINSGISFTFHCVLADEFAHIAPNILDKFYNNLFPTITAGRARFIISSTQNGYNLFYRLYRAAEAGENEYAPFKVDWWQVPEWNPDKHCWEKRDEQWRALQVANYGSEEAFNYQFGTDFTIGSKTLINRYKLKQLNEHPVQFVSCLLPGMSSGESWLWKPGYDPKIFGQQDRIIITCDLAEQLGQDYTVFLISRLIPQPNATTPRLEVVGYFRSNRISREGCVRSLIDIILKYFNMDNVLVSFEKNTYGDIFKKDIDYLIEHDTVLGNRWDPQCIVRYPAGAGTRVWTYGVKVTPGNKSQHCIFFKESLEKDLILFNDTRYLTELGNFIDDGTGHYKAAFGHDDVVMSAIQTEFVKETRQYMIFCEEWEADMEAQNRFKQNEGSPINMSFDQLDAYNGFFDYGVLDDSGVKTIYDIARDELKNRLTGSTGS